MKYELKENNKQRYIGMVLLKEIINNRAYPPVKPSGEDVYIAPYLEMLHSKGMLDINDGCYIPTNIGRSELETFFKRYNDYLRMFDIFCAVDLESGNFAFEEINNPAFSDEQWNDFLSNERWTDVRVAVADFKGLDPIEIVFMSFLTEGRFEVGAPRWQYHLTSNDTWREIEEICNTAVSREYLEEDGVLLDVIKQGSELALELIKLAEEDDALTGCEEEEIVEEVVTEEVVEEYVDVVEMPYYDYDYYDPYYDPYYVSPIWLVPLLLW